MKTMKLPGLVICLALAACSGQGIDERVAHYAGARLGVDPSQLRVTAESELDGAKNVFELVTKDGVPVLVVVVPHTGALYDSKTPGAFSRVAVSEDAANQLSRLGAERIALWYAELGGHCPRPSSQAAHFATASSGPSGVRLEYPVDYDKNDGMTRSCVIELTPKGALREARMMAVQGPGTRPDRGPM